MLIYFSKNLEVIISRELGTIFIHELFLENYHQIYASVTWGPLTPGYYVLCS